MIDRPAPRNDSTGRACELIHAGTMLKITPVSIDTPNPNCPQGDNTCLFLVPRQFKRFAVTREINDG